MALPSSSDLQESDGRSRARNMRSQPSTSGSDADVDSASQAKIDTYMTRKKRYTKSKSSKVPDGKTSNGTSGKTASLSEESPKVTISHIWFPHIMDNILQHRVAWYPFRSTCRMYRDKVDKKLREHLVLSASVDWIWERDDCHLCCDCDCHCCDDPIYCSCDLSTCNFSDGCIEVPPCRCQGPNDDWDPRFVTIDVKAATGPIPLVKPRYYDDRGRQWDKLHPGRANATKLRTVKNYLHQARVIDIPIGLSEEDLTWFLKHLKRLEIARFYNLMDTEEPEITTVPVSAHTVVLPSFTIDDDNRWDGYLHPDNVKVVFNVLYRPEEGSFTYVNSWLQPLQFLVTVQRLVFLCAVPFGPLEKYSSNLCEEEAFLNWQAFVEFLADIVVLNNNLVVTAVGIPFPPVTGGVTPPTPQPLKDALHSTFTPYLKEHKGCSAEEVGSCLARFEVLTTTEYESQLTPGQFQLEYMPCD